jgi:hypothetical protein
MEGAAGGYGVGPTLEGAAGGYGVGPTLEGSAHRTPCCTAADSKTASIAKVFQQGVTIPATQSPYVENANAAMARAMRFNELCSSPGRA